MTRIACIGSRETPTAVREWMEGFGAQLVASYTIVSGNAPGADQAWVRYVNTIAPGRVELCLPWATFEHSAIHPDNKVRVFDLLEHSYETAIASEMHPRWTQLAGPAKMLLTRDVMIVRDTRLVIGYVDPHKRLGGGTGFAFRVAQRFDIPTIDVAKPSERHRLECAMRDGRLEELMKVDEPQEAA